MPPEYRLIPVRANDIDALKDYVEALYRLDEDFDAMVNIHEGVQTLLRNEQLVTAYFIRRGDDRIGYVILTKYHSVEKGGLTFYIDELYVESKHRRHGVGAEVMNKIVEIARTSGAKALWAQAEPYNDAAKKFFEGQGFHVNPYVNFERQV